MFKTESVLTNEINKILWNFKIQTDHLIPARRLDQVLIDKKKENIICRLLDFAIPADHKVKIKESETKNK